jgi:hypothetical protein
VQGSTAAGGSYQPGMSFVSSVDFSLTQIDIALSHDSGTNSAVLTLNSDIDGLPGAVIMSWSLDNIPYTALTCCTVQTVVSSSPVTLIAGVPYWIVVTAGGPDTSIDWFRNSISATGTTALNNGGSGFFANTNVVGAFDIVGDTVPEPSTGFSAAGGLALLLFGLRSRRVKRSNPHPANHLNSVNP